jgi:hypothetical protein
LGHPVPSEFITNTPVHIKQYQYRSNATVRFNIDNPPNLEVMIEQEMVEYLVRTHLYQAYIVEYKSGSRTLKRLQQYLGKHRFLRSKKYSLLQKNKTEPLRSHLRIIRQYLVYIQTELGNEEITWHEAINIKYLKQFPDYLEKCRREGLAQRIKEASGDDGDEGDGIDDGDIDGDDGDDGDIDVGEGDDGDIDVGEGDDGDIDVDCDGQNLLGEDTIKALQRLRSTYSASSLRNMLISLQFILDFYQESFIINEMESVIATNNNKLLENATQHNTMYNLSLHFLATATTRSRSNASRAQRKAASIESKTDGGRFATWNKVYNAFLLLEKYWFGPCVKAINAGKQISRRDAFRCEIIIVLGLCLLVPTVRASNYSNFRISQIVKRQKLDNEGNVWIEYILPLYGTYKTSSTATTKAVFVTKRLSQHLSFFLDHVRPLLGTPSVGNWAVSKKKEIKQYNDLLFVSFNGRAAQFYLPFNEIGRHLLGLSHFGIHILRDIFITEVVTK